MWKLVAFCFLPICITADTNVIIRELEEKKDLETLLVDLMNRLINNHEISCITFLSDPIYLNVFEGAMFRRTLAVPYVMIVVTEYEDLLSPNFLTVKSLRQARKDGCNVYVIFLANGLQAARLLRFGDRHRVIDTRAKYIMLHDYRLFHSDLHYIWKRIVNVIFLKYHPKASALGHRNAWFDITSVPFPNPIRSVLVPKRLDIWREGKFHYSRLLFKDKTSDLRGETLSVVYIEHMPAVIKHHTNTSEKVTGVEIEILNTIAQKMNFHPKLYEPINADLYKWGHKQINGSYSGLLGEMVNGKADIALANLQYTPYHLELTDLTVPYITQCLTFLTPEALTDNAWKTLILPFRLEMWIAVLLVLLITGAIFYGMAHYYVNLLEFELDEAVSRSNSTVAKIKKTPTYAEFKPVGLYIFSQISNSVLYTFGMLLVVSLPKLPNGWSIRLLTGWYWLYCILLVVSYRASMTAILANPAHRVTIDTLEQLVNSKVTCGGWGTETKKFFIESFDEMSHQIGMKFESVNDPEMALRRIVKGTFAYYDNVYFLKYLSMKGRHIDFTEDFMENSTIDEAHALSGPIDEKALHIMADCVVNVPVSIGLQKNSPLKPLADKYISRIFEVGLVEKWLNDAMHSSRSAEIDSVEEIKALMNLKKLYGAFIALAIGYTLSAICLIAEILHWHIIVKRDPAFDKYAMDLYYSKKKNKKQ